MALSPIHIESHDATWVGLGLGSLLSQSWGLGLFSLAGYSIYDDT